MDILRFLGGPGLFLVIGILLVVVVRYKKFKKR